MREASALPLLLKELRLPTIGHLWQSIVRDADEKGWSYEKFLTTLCDYEIESRHQKRIQTFIKKSNLPYGKTLSTFDFKEVDKLNKPKVDDLAHNTNWIRQAENLLIFGPSGVGKTHLGAAIGHSLIERGVKVLFTSATSLVQNLQVARKNYNLPMTLSKLDQYDLLIIDDIGYVRKDEGETHVLFELIAHRYESSSLIVTSNQPFSEWDQIFATNSMTVAAIDRLVHHATILEINSESYRKKQSLKNHLN
ncbi:MAG: IS21 family transposase [Alphaproteobacteria bacterium 16-39-46]|nr:MAG: IS21 family transposase [Alphaproteobacteria bacterium 16-39-46]OZA43699.1 MAG: IS21 family transposase [Alphaproteobacteria bacterium 17-39-52]HQS83649.1 IS21-like element helper ATPase IstB [Alphaproteobacteria bacterium]HQS93576.1 IS21-like element helper ATPase IstB [Alphaproteobacteria bacterium]